MTSSYSSLIETIIQEHVSETKVLNEFMFGPSTSSIQVHDELNPNLWTPKKRLRPEVRNTLMRIADEFLASLKMKIKPEVKDVILTGSNANYNYSPASDLDLHLVIDCSQVPNMDKDSALSFFTNARVLWNGKRNLSIRGIKVEVFVEDLDTPQGTGGIFSVARNKWIVPPIKFDLNRHDPRVKQIARRWIKNIKAAIATGDVNKMVACFKEMRDERRKGIEEGEGESSPENLAFKVVRNNTKWIEKLFSAMDQARDAKLSIKEADEQLNEFFFGPPDVKLHNKLHKDLWDGDHLKPDVREQLLKIAKAFMGFIGKNFKIQDIRFKGSMANYNYTKASDIDVHIIAPISEADQKLIEHARTAWKEKYKVKVYGYPVELGIDPPNKIHTSSAVYSLMNDKWIDKPTGNRPEIDLKRVDTLYKDWKSRLEAALDTGDLKQIKQVEKEIRAARDKALPGSKNPKERWNMEMSELNLAFKRLRDTGILDRIKALSNRDREDSLSLKKPGFFG